MNVLIIGEGRRSDELMSALSIDGVFVSNDVNRTFDVVFDSTFDSDTPGAWPENFAGVAVVSAVNKTLGSSSYSGPTIGMNLIPTFIGGDLKEWSFADSASRKAGGKLAQQLHWEFREVHDQIGMVTPRILFQIINEACFTLEEGTASIEDIDNAMKLGTNYPYGPFEWAQRIGIQEVVDTLRALSSVDPQRYQVCQLLQDKCERGELFYPNI